jgi:hypothetical protein
LGIDSLVLPEMLARLRDKLRVELSMGEVPGTTDVKGLCDMISSRIGDHGEEANASESTNCGSHSARERPQTSHARYTDRLSAVLEVLNQALDISAESILEVSTR